MKIVTVRKMGKLQLIDTARINLPTSKKKVRRVSDMIKRRNAKMIRESIYSIATASAVFVLVFVLFGGVN